MCEQDIRALFTCGSKTDANNFYRAILQAKYSLSKASVFTSAGKEFVLLKSLDDDTWSYRRLAENV